MMTADLPYARPQEMSPVSYGTAGFRMSYDVCPARLESILYRMGVLAALRAFYKKATIGLMVTASHNPESDNGVKLIDPHGEMLEVSWEALATRLANCSDETLSDEAAAVAKEYNIIIDKETKKLEAKVFVGRDTRMSSLRLIEAALAGVKRMGALHDDAGILTTPQLHFLVRESNVGSIRDDPYCQYINRFVTDAFVNQLSRFRPRSYSAKLFVDCANGVGSLAAKSVAEAVRGCGLEMVVRNQWSLETSQAAGPLNDMCGADFVKLHIAPPKVYDGPSFAAGERWISFDGDADRVVYYFSTSVQGEERFVLLDGDRIATLYAVFFKELLETTGLSKSLSLGLVQTAYANGRSTKYITQCLGLPVSCVPTGVKFLHAEAHRRFDVGIYFEANGHGTVVFSNKAHRLVAEAVGADGDSAALQHLAGAMALVNEAVGDAVTDVLLAEHVLACRGWDLSTWAAQYIDLPVCQLKVAVKQRSVVKTSDAERRCEAPDGLQAAIDRLTVAVASGRAFVRPSGTEDVVRVYAECEGLPEDARCLAVKVAAAVYDLAGGVGPRPS